MTEGSLLIRLTAPLTAVLLALLTASGVVLALHGGGPGLRELNMLASVLVVLPAALCLWGWRAAIVEAFRQPVVAVTTGLAVAGAAAAVMAFAGTGETEDPRLAVYRSLRQAPISAVAVLAGMDAPTALQTLSSAGFPGALPEESVSVVAERSGREVFEVIGALVRPASVSR